MKWGKNKFNEKMEENSKIRFYCDDPIIQLNLNLAAKMFKFSPIPVDVNFSSTSVRSSTNTLKINSNNSVQTIKDSYQMYRTLSKNLKIPIQRRTHLLTEFLSDHREIRTVDLNKSLPFPFVVQEKHTREILTQVYSNGDLKVFLEETLDTKSFEFSNLVLKPEYEITEKIHLHVGKYLTQNLVNYQLRSFHRVTKSGLLFASDSEGEIYFENDRKKHYVSRALVLALDALETVNLDYGILTFGYTEKTDSLILLDISNKINEFVVYPDIPDFYLEMYKQSLVHTVLNKYQATRNQKLITLPKINLITDIQ